MSRCGRGWEVGVCKAIHQRKRALRLADELARARRTPTLPPLRSTTPKPPTGEPT